MKRSGRIAGIWLLCAVVIALLFMTGILDKQKTWTELKQEYTGGDNLWRVEDGDAYGTVATGPYFDLPVGTYRIKWQIEGDGENRIVLSNSNDAAVTPDEFIIYPDKWQDEAWFEIKEHTHSLSVNVQFASGSWMQLHNIRLYSPMYTDNAWTVSLLLIALCALVTMHLLGRLTPQGMKEIALLAIAVLLVSQPCLGENSPMAYDTHFHAARIMNLADGLRSGLLPVRAAGFSYNGYGAMTSVFYPDLLLYPWALALLGGASITWVINSLVVVVNALTAACMYSCAKRMLGHRQGAMCAAILYVFSIYRLEDLYCRLMVGEMLAMAFVPVFLLGLYEVILGDKRRWPVLVLGATLVFRSHMLSTVLCAGVALVMGLLFIRKIFKEKRLSAIAAAIAAALLINLNQIVPMLMSVKAGVNTTVVGFGFAGAALSLEQLLRPGEYIGLALLVGAAAFVAADAQEKSARRVLWLIFAAGAACAVLATNIIPWGHVSVLTRGLVDTLQFPWRFLLLTSVCFALCGGDGLARLLGGNGLRAATAALALGMICSMPYIGTMSPYDYELEFGQGAKTYMIYPEYQIEGTNVNDTRSHEVLLDGEAQLTHYEKRGTRIDAHVQAAQETALSFPLFGFPGYEACVDGETAPWRLGENNRLTVAVPAGAHHVQIRYAGKTLWTALDILSLLCALGLAVYGIDRKKRRWI